MTSNINSLLGQIREHLSMDEAAWGPESAQVMDPDSTLSGTAGDGGAHNVQDIGDAMDKYIMGLVGNLMAIFDMTEETALSIVEKVASEMAADGMMPELPADGAEDGELSRWMGSATTAGLGGAVVQFARDHAS